AAPAAAPDEAAPPAPAHRISSTPSHATVRIAGRTVCTTPCRIEGSERRRVAVLSSPGHDPARLVVPPGGGEELRVTLRRTRDTADTPPELPEVPF
ncbi:MAG: PEGA domain-containing protein, partial [Myxococcota bacterium]|nr:PEGA domain-containing protein [Myxococcota bacterium]